MNILIITIFILSSYIDIKSNNVYSPLNMLILVLGLVKHITSNFNIINILMGISVIPLVLLILNLIKRDSIGLGDIEYISALGFYYGYYIQTISLFISTILLLIYSLLNKKKRYPFIPFLSIGFMLTSLFIR